MLPGELHGPISKHHSKLYNIQAGAGGWAGVDGLGWAGRFGGGGLRGQALQARFEEILEGMGL